jgi:VWFA-related protein
MNSSFSPSAPAALSRLAIGLLLAALFAGVPQAWAQAAEVDRAVWPESQRAFAEDGPGWLLGRDRNDALAAMPEEERQAWISEFLRDPIPATAENELELAIEKRRALVRREFVTFLDERARALFLHGEPALRELISCDQTFVPLEVWWYGPPETSRGYIFYEPISDDPFRLWLPLDSKRALYGRDMAYWLQQVAEVTGGRKGPRFDRRLCKQVKLIDEVTGVEGLYGFREGRPTNGDVLALFEPPAEVAAWAEQVLQTPLGAVPPVLLVDTPEVFFPEVKSQRMVSRVLLRVPDDAGLAVYRENEKAEVRVKVEGVVERAGKRFESFNVRYQIPVEDEPPELALLLDRLLRPEDSFVVRMRILDEIGGAVHHATLGFRVPSQAQPEEDLPEDVLVARGVDVEPVRVPGVDSMVIIPPETDVVLGLWRVETLISGERIQKVVFTLDGKAQMTRSKPPFEAELRLARYPTEHVVGVQGFDATGELIASDEVVLNQQRGRLEVSVLEPARGAVLTGSTLAKASVVLPEERQLDRVEFLVDEEVVATLKKPPWQTEVAVPEVRGQGDVHYLTVAAYLDDGTRAEDVRFLNTPDYLEQVEVDLVELYTSVEGDAGRTLQQADFTVLEDGRSQEILRFELVEDLPITIGITIDTSGSMIESLGEAKRAAVDFLENIITPKDQSFAVSFSNHPILLMTRTSDVGAVEAALDDLHAVGNTSLYDSVVTSLYYFRGVRGRRALVLLSDGEDTASSISFKESLDYARRSGVAIYTIGLNIGSTQLGVRGKLNDLARETGGRSFYISKAHELATVYREIDKELRSQYLLAYSSDAAPESTEFRVVQVRVKGKLKARTISGYYP